MGIENVWTSRNVREFQKSLRIKGEDESSVAQKTLAEINEAITEIYHKIVFLSPVCQHSFVFCPNTDSFDLGNWSFRINPFFCIIKLAWNPDYHRIVQIVVRYSFLNDQRDKYKVIYPVSIKKLAKFLDKLFVLKGHLASGFSAANRLPPLFR